MNDHQKLSLVFVLLEIKFSAQAVVTLLLCMSTFLKMDPRPDLVRPYNQLASLAGLRGVDDSEVDQC